MKSSYLRRQIIDVNGLEISVISKEDLIMNKKASGSHRDLDDAEILEKSENDKKKKTIKKRNLCFMEKLTGQAVPGANQGESNG